MQKETLTLVEAAALLNVDEETLRQLAASGEVYGAKIGRAWTFLRVDILGFLKSETRKQTAERRSPAVRVRGVVRRRSFRKLPAI